MAQEDSAVLSRVKSILRSDSYWASASADIHEAMERLVASSEMAAVWDGLSVDSTAPDLPELFLDACIIALMQWRRISKTPTKQIESDLAQIEKIARRLASLLRIHEADLSLRNTPTTVASLIRQQAQLAGQDGFPSDKSAIKAIQDALARRPDGTDTSSEACDALDDQSDIPLEHVLELLAKDLQRLWSSELAIIRPTRIKAENAERTYYSRELTRFFRTHGGDPHNEWVARSVNALLDLVEKPLDAIWVRHLFEDIEDFP